MLDVISRAKIRHIFFILIGIVLKKSFKKKISPNMTLYSCNKKGFVIIRGIALYK